MRRKITAASADYSDLPKLTSQQENFVKGILDGKSASDAYRAAYSTDNMKPETIWAAASRLRANSNVGAWLSAAIKAGVHKAARTLEDHIRRLDRLQEIAVETGNVGAAVQAEQLAGKVSGHYTERLEINSSDPMDALREVAKLSPDLAKQLADESGINLDDTEPTTH